MRILPGALQLRHSLAKPAGIKKVFAQIKSELEIGRIPRQSLARMIDEDLCTLRFGGLQLLQLLRMRFVWIVRREKFLLRSDFPLEAFNFQIRNFPSQP